MRECRGLPLSALHYQVRGRGRDLVLLHGWSTNLGVWDSLTEHLARRFRVIALDLPGHGASDWDPQAVTPAAQAWRVHETLAPLTERYALLGWSLGGQFALDLAAAMPAAITRLALVSTTPKFLSGAGWRCGSARTFLQRLAYAVQADAGRAVDEFLRLCARGLAPRTAGRVLAALRGALRAHGAACPQALMSGLERLAHGDLRAALPLVRVPSLVIAGQHDRHIRPAASRALAAALPQGRYVQIAGATHAPFLSHARQFAELLTGFLRG
jgi:pimeloyl-[acyl-carrier protein] methyl ester esterase